MAIFCRASAVSALETSMPSVATAVRAPELLTSVRAAAIVAASFAAAALDFFASLRALRASYACQTAASAARRAIAAASQSMRPRLSPTRRRPGQLHGQRGRASRVMKVSEGAVAFAKGAGLGVEQDRRVAVPV